MKSNTSRPAAKRTAQQRPTLRDVAEIAGFTPATASYVLSGNTKVTISATTRERVLRAANQLGYRPHLAARSLATGRTRTIGLCFGNEGAAPFVDDYDRQIMHGVLQGTASASYALQVVGSLGGQMPHDVDGWVAVQTRGDFNLDCLGQVPVVFLDPHEPAPDQVCVWADNAGGGHLLAGQLATRHRSILVMLHEPLARTAFSYRERLLAFRARWSELVPGGKLETGTLHPDAPPGDRKKFLQACVEMIRRGQISHIACLSDLQASLINSLLRDAGLRVPRDVTLSGFDNTLHGILCSPGISTVDLHAAQTGQIAVARLIGILSGAPAESGTPIPPAWIERESTGASSPPGDDAKPPVSRPATPGRSRLRKSKPK